MILFSRKELLPYPVDPGPAPNHCAQHCEQGCYLLDRLAAQANLATSQNHAQQTRVQLGQSAASVAAVTSGLAEAGW